MSQFFEEVVWLCRVDDEARLPGACVAPLEAYRERLEDLAVSLET